MYARLPKHFNYILIVKQSYEHVSSIYFWTFVEFIVMLAAMPFLNNNTAMAQGYNGNS